jgi:hypothetical protein
MDYGGECDDLDTPDSYGFEDYGASSDQDDLSSSDQDDYQTDDSDDSADAGTYDTSATPGMVAPIPGTQSGPGVATSWDASGQPTHVTYGGVVDPPTTNVTVGGVAPPSTGVVQDDPTHVTLGYIPEQVPHQVEPPDQAEYPTTAAGWQHADQMQQTLEANQDVMTRAAGYTPIHDYEP